MRWTLLSTISLYILALGVEVNALPAPIVDDGSVALEARARAKPRAALRKAKVVQGHKAAAFKKSSNTYRNAAAKSSNPIFRVKNGKISKSKPNGKVQKGLDADHIVEAQTVAHAVNNSKKKPSATALKAAKNILNSPSNMAFLDKTTNILKGKSATAAAKGRSVTPNKHVQSYLQATKQTGEQVASALTKVFSQHGAKVDVTKAHNAVLKANKVKRALMALLDELD